MYQSRSRGLWVKGESSGATQDLLRVKYDCDRDTLCFVVRQHGSVRQETKYEKREREREKKKRETKPLFNFFILFLHVFNFFYSSMQGFCHLNTQTCFGTEQGLDLLLKTLQVAV